MKRAVLILSPDDATGRLCQALQQSQWTVHTAASMREVPKRLAQQVTAILAPMEQYGEVSALARKVGAEAKIVATMPFSDRSGEEATAGAFSILRRPLAPSEVLEVLGFASSGLQQLAS